MDFQCELKRRTDYANAVISRYLPERDDYTAGLLEAMRYSVLAGGKRLRPVFMDCAYRMYGGKDDACEPFMAAMEYLHTYSLVHDDMPAIDNDDYRRGQLTTHKKFGEACGLLAGDGLLHLSTQVALQSSAFITYPARAVKTMTIFAGKSGHEGMLGGQAVDVLFTGEHPDLKRLDFVYRLKTCALIEGSLMMGAALAGAPDGELAKLEAIGRQIGMAFQIKDDILDCTSDAATLGKPIGSDLKNDKTTYAGLLGLTKAQETVETMSKDALTQIRALTISDEDERIFLLNLTDSLVNRTY